MTSRMLRRSRVTRSDEKSLKIRNFGVFQYFLLKYPQTTMKSLQLLTYSIVAVHVCVIDQINIKSNWNSGLENHSQQQVIKPEGITLQVGDSIRRHKDAAASNFFSLPFKNSLHSSVPWGQRSITLFFFSTTSNFSSVTSKTLLPFFFCFGKFNFFQSFMIPILVWQVHAFLHPSCFSHLLCLESHLMLLEYKRGAKS